MFPTWDQAVVARRALTTKNIVARKPALIDTLLDALRHGMKNDPDRPERRVFIAKEVPLTNRSLDSVGRP
jgi:hypothetical protein